MHHPPYWLRRAGERHTLGTMPTVMDLNKPVGMLVRPDLMKRPRPVTDKKESIWINTRYEFGYPRQVFETVWNTMSHLQKVFPGDTFIDDNLMPVVRNWRCFFDQNTGLWLKAPRPSCAGAWKTVAQNMGQKYQTVLRNNQIVDFNAAPQAPATPSQPAAKIHPAVFVVGALALYAILSRDSKAG